MPPKKAKKTKKQLEEERSNINLNNNYLRKTWRRATYLRRTWSKTAWRRGETKKGGGRAQEKRRRKEKSRRGKTLSRRSSKHTHFLFILKPKYFERENQLREKHDYAKKARKKDLDDKYLACDPLPDPENEKDLSTYLTLWKESKDSTLQDCIKNC